MQCGKWFFCCLLVIGLPMVDTAFAESVIQGLSWADVGGTQVRFDDYVSNPQPGGNVAEGATVAAFSGVFQGFVSPSSANTTVSPLPSAIGVLVSHSTGTVTFADQVSLYNDGGEAIVSDIQMGGAAAATSLTFTFVDPSNPSVNVAVSRFALKYGLVNSDDSIYGPSNVGAHFYDLSGNEIALSSPSVGVVPGSYWGSIDEAHGYEATVDGVETNLIHSVVVTSNPNNSYVWMVGSANDPNTYDMAFASVASVPEPGSLVLLATGLIGLLCYAWRKRK